MLLALAPAALAADNPEDILLEQVYAGGGSTLYCGTEFTRSSRLKVDYIYPEKQLLRHFSCITSRQCSSKDGYAEVAGDLHNLYPVERSVELDRRGTKFADLPENVEFSECGYQLSFQTFDPPKSARGNIARAYVYMHKQHKLPLAGNIEMYQRWSKEDPPDDAEKARNSAIFRIQGNRNPYIDDPSLLDRMTGNSGRF